MSFLSSFAVNYLALSMELNYSIVLISIQELWLTLEGNEKMYGFMFGSYAVGQMLSAPLLGYLSDRRGLRFACILSLIVNIIGNIMYGVSFISHSVALVCIGRALVGFSAGAVILGIVHISNTTSREDRKDSVATFQTSRAVGQAAGPFIAFALVGMKSPSDKTSEVFNFFTTPGWICLANAIILLPIFRCMFKNPMAPHNAMRFRMQDAKKLVNHVSYLSMVILLASTSFWGITSYLYDLAFGQYHLIKSQQDMWKLYITAGSAIVIAMVTLKFAVHRFLSPALFTLFGLAVIVVGFILLLDFNTASHEPPHEGFYYSGVAFASAGGSWFFTGMNTYYSQKITDFTHQARNRRGTFMALASLADSLGRFLGPFILSFILDLKQISVLPCTPSEYFSDGCILVNINSTLYTLCGLLVVAICSFIFYHVYFGNVEREGVDILVSNMEISYNAHKETEEAPDDFVANDL